MPGTDARRASHHIRAATNAVVMELVARENAKNIVCCFVILKAFGDQHRRESRISFVDVLGNEVGIRLTASRKQRRDVDSID